MVEIVGKKKPKNMEITTIKVNEVTREIVVPNFIKKDVSILDQDKVVRQLEAVVVSVIEKAINSVNLELLLVEMLKGIIFKATKTLEIKDVKLIPTEVKDVVIKELDVTEYIKEQIKILINK